jgi:hypothetical protein
MVADALVRIKGKEGIYRLRRSQPSGGRWLDAWSTDTQALHSAHLEDVRQLCGDCTTRLDTGRRARESCPTCEKLEVK